MRLSLEFVHTLFKLAGPEAGAPSEFSAKAPVLSHFKKHCGRLSPRFTHPLTRPSATLSPAGGGGEGWGEEALGSIMVRFGHTEI